MGKRRFVKAKAELHYLNETQQTASSAAERRRIEERRWKLKADLALMCQIANRVRAPQVLLVLKRLGFNVVHYRRRGPASCVWELRRGAPALPWHPRRPAWFQRLLHKRFAHPIRGLPPGWRKPLLYPSNALFAVVDINNGELSLSIDVSNQFDKTWQCPIRVYSEQLDREVPASLFGRLKRLCAILSSRRGSKVGVLWGED